MVVEVKELTKILPSAKRRVFIRTVGDHIRRKIAQAGPQLQTASKEGKPTILLVFNGLVPMQQFGTEDHDFEHAMYGEYTVRLDRGIGEIVDSFHGRNAKLRVAVNTSFSAVGRLKQSGGGAVEVTLFENIHGRSAELRGPACLLRGGQGRASQVLIRNFGLQRVRKETPDRCPRPGRPVPAAA